MAILSTMTSQKMTITGVDAYNTPTNGDTNETDNTTGA